MAQVQNPLFEIIYLVFTKNNIYEYIKQKPFFITNTTSNDWIYQQHKNCRIMKQERYKHYK